MEKLLLWRKKESRIVRVRAKCKGEKQQDAKCDIIVREEVIWCKKKRQLFKRK